MKFSILDNESTSRFSKAFAVETGNVVVISSFNFACEQKNEIGDVTKKRDCAILHKLDVSGSPLPSGSGCMTRTEVVFGKELVINSSEPVVQCNELWTHNSQNNISVLSVPGYYMFELCDESSVGNVTIQAERLPLDEAQLLPRSLFHGE